MNVLLRALRTLREVDRVAAPASTLLWATIVFALLATVARAHPSAESWQAAVVSAAEASPSPVTAWVPEAAAAGEPLRFAVEWAPLRARPVEAYLPGLVYGPVSLELDAESGLLHGVLRVPETAPRRGWFTLRLVGDEGAEWDLRIPLVAPAEPTGTI